MRLRIYKIAAPALLLITGITLAGCTGSGNSNNNTPAQLVTYTQVDRLGRPAINEVFATVANDRHAVNDLDSPTNDVNELANDIQTFMTGTAGRSQAITDVVKAVLVPDLIKADLSQTGVNAAYLGVETGGQMT